MLPVLDPERPDLGGNLRHGDLGTWCPLLWSFLIERHNVRSMLDVGCGEGHAVSYFYRKGVIAHGIDGLRLNIERSIFPVALHDLTLGAYFMPCDLVWSCEVAEHIGEAHVDNYLETLCNGKSVAMTHALPGQKGHHHVNCQPPEYWVSKLEARGFILDNSFEQVRAVAMKESHFSYFSRSGLLFHRL